MIIFIKSIGGLGQFCLKCLGLKCVPMVFCVTSSVGGRGNLFFGS